MSIRGDFDLDDTLAVTPNSRDTLLADAIEAVDSPPITREEYQTVNRQRRRP